MAGSWRQKLLVVRRVREDPDELRKKIGNATIRPSDGGVKYRTLHPRRRFTATRLLSIHHRYLYHHGNRTQSPRASGATRGRLPPSHPSSTAGLPPHHPPWLSPPPLRRRASGVVYHRRRRKGPETTTLVPGVSRRCAHGRPQGRTHRRRRRPSTAELRALAGVLPRAPTAPLHARSPRGMI